MFLATRPRKMTRLMQSTKVRADKLAAYKKFHASVWPEVEAGLLKYKYGITTLSIWGPSDGSNQLISIRTYCDCHRAPAGRKGAAKNGKPDTHQVKYAPLCAAGILRSCMKLTVALSRD
jgi:hypothetical protein